MIDFNVQKKLPKQAAYYFLLKGVFLSLGLIFLGYIFLNSGPVNGTKTINGITTATSFSPHFIGILCVIIGSILPIYKLIWISLFRYSINELTITISSGVIIRQSKTIDHVRIQSIETIAGPIQMLFGISELNIWTASPNQTQSVSTYSTINSSGARISHSSVRNVPEGKLYLQSADAEELRVFISNKGAVQNVNIASSNPVSV